MDLLSQLQAILNEHPQHWSPDLSLKRNEYLKVKGSIDTRIFFVKTGSLRIFIEDEFEEHTIRFGYQGSFITALDSYITGKPSPFYIQALKKTELKVMSREAFRSIMESQEEYMALWHKMQELLIYQQLEREIDILTYSPAERYRRVLERSPQLFQEIPSKYIASYLRMTPETLSRLKKS